MQAVDGKENLSSVELSSFFCKSFALSEVSEHFSSANEIHNKKYLLLGLEGILQADQERMINYLMTNVLF